MCLSESYFGRAFTNVYAIDPVKGEEVDLEIDLDLTMSDLRSAYSYERWDEGTKVAAASSLLKCIVGADFNRALDRNIRGAVESAFAKCGAEQGERSGSGNLNRGISGIAA